MNFKIMRIQISMSILLYIVPILSFLSCTRTLDDTLIIREEIENLQTFENKKVYLEQVFEDDQRMRRGGQSTQIGLKYGHNSKEHMEFIKTMNALDALNLVKIELYLEKYGHPIKKEVGELAAIAPWAVIHHSSTYEDRVRNFEYLYKAYKNQDIEDGHFSMFLDRMYRFKYDERLDMGMSYKEKDRIERLIKELKLITN